MNDLDYEKMIEIPVNTCDLTYVKSKKFKRKRTDFLKRRLMQAINGKDKQEEEATIQPESIETIEEPCEFADTVEIVSKKEERKRKRKLSMPKIKLDVVTAQVGVIIVLVLTIMLTNIFWSDSGINNLVRNVFSSGESKEEDVSYTEFSAQSPVRISDVVLEEGVMTFSGEGSIYPVCDGKIVKVAENAGKFDITIEYSPSFSSVISGAEYAYYGLGDSVFKSLPVCYSSGGEVTVALYDNGKLLSNYVIDNGKIVWQS